MNPDSDGLVVPFYAGRGLPINRADKPSITRPALMLKRYGRGCKPRPALKWISQNINIPGVGFDLSFFLSESGFTGF